MVSDLRSCTMLSTLPLFYIAQSVNSDDRRTRIQGLRVIMLTDKTTTRTTSIYLDKRISKKKNVEKLEI